MRWVLMILFALCNATVTGQTPHIKVLDTDFSKGRLAQEQIISLQDVAKLHGHLCDGLVVGFLGLREGLYKLYPSQVIDRTNTRIVSKSSPCITDVAIYLTGGRYQFNTFFVSDSIQYLFVVQRKDNEQAYGVRLKPGVKPKAIDSMGALANLGILEPCELEVLRKLEDKFINHLLASPLALTFTTERIENYKWNPVLQNTFIKTDVLNKNKASCKDTERPH